MKIFNVISATNRPQNWDIYENEIGSRVFIVANIRLTLLKKGFVTPRMIAGRAELLLDVISLKSASCIV